RCQLPSWIQVAPQQAQDPWDLEFRTIVTDVLTQTGHRTTRCSFPGRGEAYSDWSFPHKSVRTFRAKRKGRRRQAADGVPYPWRNLLTTSTCSLARTYIARLRRTMISLRSIRMSRSDVRSTVTSTETAPLVKSTSYSSTVAPH